MQLKIVTRKNVFRFSQSGQPLREITEPFVNVEAYTREDVVALFDQHEEHLARAFQYEDGEITGMSADATVAIQQFFLAEGAWYLQALNQPQDDQPAGEAHVPESTGGEAGNPAEAMASQAPAAPDPSLFTPTESQRNLLREIQTYSQAIPLLQPDPHAPWNRKLQQQLLAKQLLDLDDPEAAHRLAETRLAEKLAEAHAAGIPGVVIEANRSAHQCEIEPGEEGEED